MLIRYHAGLRKPILAVEGVQSFIFGQNIAILGAASSAEPFSVTD